MSAMPITTANAATQIHGDVPVICGSVTLPQSLMDLKTGCN